MIDANELRLLAENLHSCSGPHRCAAALSKAADEIERLRIELATAQAREVKLRQAMMRATIGGCSCLTKTPDPAFHKEHCGYRVLMEALALPTDDTALRERLRAERERVALMVDDKFDFCGDEIVIADTIRAMEDEK